jgi:hypothetical protein
MSTRPQKITFAQMRSSGVRGLLVYCCDYKCSHLRAIGGDPWPDDVRLSDIEPRFVCTTCGKRGADVRPDFQLEREAGLRDGIGFPAMRNGIRPSRPHVACLTAHEPNC